jgi:hypothetical protein
VRWQGTLLRADTLTPAQLLDLIVAADALRRPERLDWLIDATSAHAAAARPQASEGVMRSAALLREALAVVRNVDAATIAGDAIRRAAQVTGRSLAPGEAIGSALRDARIAALRDWRRRASDEHSADG